MKRIIFYCIILSSFIINAQDEIIESKVISATVFKNRALVMREAELSLPAGKHKVIFSNLSTDLQNESVRISAKGPGSVKILDVKVEQRFTTETQQEAIKRMEIRIDSLNQFIFTANDELAVLESKREFIESLKAGSSRYLNEKMLLNVNSTKEWNEMLSYVEKNLTEIYKGIREQNYKKAVIQEQINTIRKEISNSQGKKSKNFKEIIVMVDNGRGGRIKLNPSYIVESASWYPLYDARVKLDAKTTELHYFGMIYQSTGEDWKDISLTLSTAEPMATKSLPELDRWFIDIKPLPVKRDYRSSRSGSSSYHVSYENNYGLQAGTGSITGYVTDNQTGEPLIGANIILENTSLGSATDLNGKYLIPNIPAGTYNIRFSYVGYFSRTLNTIKIEEKQNAILTVPLEASLPGQAIEIRGEKIFEERATNTVKIMQDEKYVGVYARELSTSFEIPSKIFIPSDNSPHKVTISIEEMPVEFNYTSIPKINPAVYLKGKILNNNEYPLLQGEINIFVDNDFINRAQLNTVVANDTFQLPLGIDDRIQIKKILINKFQETKGFLSGKKQITYEYEIQLTNNRKTEERILIFDQIPITMNEEIEIELLEPKIVKENLGSDQKIEWDIILKPGEKKIIPVKYLVSAPGKFAVYGLE